MKKIICLFIVMAMLPNLFCLNVGAKSSAPVSERAQVFVHEICKTAFSSGEVTRSEFAAVMVRALVGELEASKAESYFADVTEKTENYQYINKACEMGIVAEAKKFSPDTAIMLSEAVTMAVCALGYGYKAEYYGGYPAGYSRCADEAELYKNLNRANTVLTSENAYILMYNFLNAQMLYEEIGTSDRKYYKNGETILEKYRNIKRINGIVTATFYSSIESGEGLAANRIAIDGKTYAYCGAQSYDMLGLAYEAYIYDFDGADEEAVLLLSDYDEICTINNSDFKEIGDTKIYYYNEAEQTKSRNISRERRIFQNGIPSAQLICDTESEGKIRLIDNDADGTADVIYCDTYRYITVSGVDVRNNVISDKNSAENAVYIEDTEKFCYSDTDGNKLNIFDVASGNVIKILDNSGHFVIAQQIRQSVKGKIESIDEDEIKIGENVYKISNYMKKYCLDGICAGGSYIFICDGDCLVSVSIGVPEMEYGFVKWMSPERDADDECYKMKIFTVNGRFDIFDVKDRVVVDGIKMEDSALYSALQNGNGILPQLVRYMTDDEGRITKVDLAKNADSVKNLTSVKNEYDSLYEYHLGGGSFTYKDNGTMSGCFNIDTSVVFNVPAEYGSEDDYRISGSEVFVNDQTYSTVRIFDLDDAGNAGAVVYQRDPMSAPVYWNEDPAVVEKVRSGINEEEEAGFFLTLWKNGEYKELFMPENVTVNKKRVQGKTVRSSHEKLSSGDIIRYNLDDKGYIQRIEIDFDAREGVFAPEFNYFNDGINRALMYYEGKTYNISGSKISIDTVMRNGQYAFSLNSMRFLDVGSNIIVYDADDGRIYPVTKDNIKTYLSNGADAHYAVVCMHNFRTSLVILYEGEEQRR